MAIKKENSLISKAAALSKDENHFMADIAAILDAGRRSQT
jgi:hypothetical protein